MNWIKAVLNEVFGLFVDDGWFAAAILVWLLAVWLLQHLGIPAVWNALALFAGLAAVFAVSTTRRARR